MSSRALILGASGLVGSHLAEILVESASYDEVLLAVRQPLAKPLRGATEVKVDYENPASFELPNIQDVYCCLGTTIKKAGSQAAFRKVDYEYPLLAARALHRAGAEQFLIVTALGASKSSAVFYNRVKGEVEDDLVNVGFRQLHVFRPSLLLGERDEVRPGEKVGEAVGKLLSFAFVGPLGRYKPIQAKRVAQAMANAARSKDPGVFWHESDEIAMLAQQTGRK